MEKVAVFPGSFDPFTLGHLDILNQALNIFDRIIVAVGINLQKQCLFSCEARVAMIEEIIKDMPQVTVCSFNGLTVDFCREHHIYYIFRGLRTTTDFELEQVISQVNRKIAPEITTLFIPSGARFSFISSTVVRDILINGGDASIFMPSGIEPAKYMSI